jgi:hypothetical protein
MAQISDDNPTQRHNGSARVVWPRTRFACRRYRPREELRRTTLSWAAAAILLVVALVAALCWTMPRRIAVQVDVDGQAETATSSPDCSCAAGGSGDAT